MLRIAQAVMMNPANNLSPDVTQRVLRALRISLTQRPLPPNPVIEAGLQARPAECLDAIHTIATGPSNLLTYSL